MAKSLEAKQKDTKKQRDRFLAFAFASSDLFLEISIEGRITYALGASKSLTGFEDEDVIGKNWLELFSTYDQAQVKALYDNAQPGKRCGPVLVQLNEKISKRKAVFTALRMPENPHFYTTLGFSNMLMGKLAGEISRNKSGEILDRTAFIEQAKDTLEVAASLGQDLDLTLFDFGRTEEIKEQFGEQWERTITAIADFLQTQSVDGQTAGLISDGKFSLVHEKNVDKNFLRERMEAIITDFDPSGEGFEVQTKTIESDISKLNDRDAARALVYTINEFDRKGTKLSIETLNSGFKDYVDANAQRIKEFQSLIERLDFSLFFQPIVDIKTKEVSHYEMLSRFDRGDTMEWIMFGEDMGLAPAFDIAVCERAMTHIKHKAGGSRSKFSVNLSGQSIEDEEFIEKLQKKIKSNPNIQERLMFEITESSHIHDLDKVCEFIEKLQKDGFKIALDDFGAGSASFQYLQKLPVDYVKIDGKYVRKLLTSRRDAAMVKNLTQMCLDLNIKVIAEYVEEQTQADVLMEMGVQYAQGYLYGKAEAAPSYMPPKK